MIRFSGKELAKNAKNAIIPHDYSELKNAIEIRETDLSYQLEFVYEGVTLRKYFPKSQLIKVGSKFYAANWIIKTKIDE